MSMRFIISKTKEYLTDFIRDFLILRSLAIINQAQCVTIRPKVSLQLESVRLSKSAASCNLSIANSANDKRRREVRRAYPSHLSIVASRFCSPSQTCMSFGTDDRTFKPNSQSLITTCRSLFFGFEFRRL